MFILSPPKRGGYRLNIGLWINEAFWYSSRLLWQERTTEASCLSLSQVFHLCTSKYRWYTPVEQQISGNLAAVCMTRASDLWAPLIKLSQVTRLGFVLSFMPHGHYSKNMKDWPINQLRLGKGNTDFTAFELGSFPCITGEILQKKIVKPIELLV